MLCGRLFVPHLHTIIKASFITTQGLPTQSSGWHITSNASIDDREQRGIFEVKTSLDELSKNVVGIELD